MQDAAFLQYESVILALLSVPSFFPSSVPVHCMQIVPALGTLDVPLYCGPQ